MGIDPGSKTSGIVVWDTVNEAPRYFSQKFNNAELLKGETYLPKQNGLPEFPLDRIDLVAIERIRGYGIVAGDDIFDTCEWVGRFDQHFRETRSLRFICGSPVVLIPRKDIKKALCGNTTTNDKYVRMALIGRFGETGTKKSRGKLYGIAGHCWSALAVAVVAAEMEKVA